MRYQMVLATRERWKGPKTARQAKCAKICGLCRYINSLAVWPAPNYRRPPDRLLAALEKQRWCLTFQNIETAWPSAYWRKFHSTNE